MQINPWIPNVLYNLTSLIISVFAHKFALFDFNEEINSHPAFGSVTEWVCRTHPIYSGHGCTRSDRHTLMIEPSRITMIQRARAAQGPAGLTVKNHKKQQIRKLKSGITTFHVIDINFYIAGSKLEQFW